MEIECVLWAVVFVIGALIYPSKKECKMLNWYIVAIYWHEHGSLKFKEVDGLQSASAEDAKAIAESKWRSSMKSHESLSVEYCHYRRDINRAKKLAKYERCEEDWESIDGFVEWMTSPVFTGNQNSYYKSEV